ncbi:protein adenylyltransferase SelO [Sediminicoccus sp. KRV36]|uniref:protein adenylyltransferase SelO n=1 Tax=Sediminicoccus sp. KRV36 TaxID=3133721 RepID=UPI0020100339|nr:YdiU family protein [Sediminicoccus rosea]UPY38601.1 YdiU family protein [Sediminicoccus rosea]
MPISPGFRPARTHAALGGEFFDVVEAARFPQHILRHREQRWAARVGLDGLSDAEWIAHFGRLEPLPGSFEQPLALRYHGHQFRHYNPDLGDGRGFLFAQMHDLEDGRLLDFGTKGSGQTPWSRTADGRLTLKGGVREILATRLLEALGVNTSKSFSLIETGEDLQRNDEPSPTRSAVLVRLSHSHIRIGTFQRFAYLGDAAAISALLAHAVRHYIPEATAEAEPERAALFFAEVCRRVARMGAQWMAAGFVHGVLNTDNINITGESFDYGPWRFLPTYDPKFTAAYFDYGSLYAFGRQPETLLWNLARLGGCLLPLAGETDLKARLEESLHGFGGLVQAEFARCVLWRLGLKPIEAERDAALSGLFFTALLESEAPFERAFFDWRGGRIRDYPHAAWAPVRAALAGYERAAGDHPHFEGPGPATLLIEEVEALWAPIAESDDWGAFHAKLAQIEMARLAYRGGADT